MWGALNEHSASSMLLLFQTIVLVALVYSTTADVVILTADVQYYRSFVHRLDQGEEAALETLTDL